MHEDDPDGCHRHVYFRPGAVFARVERATPDRRQLSVLRAAGPGERVLRIAGIDPGAQLLLHATTTARTELALQAIAAIERSEENTSELQPLMRYSFAVSFSKTQKYLYSNLTNNTIPT